MYFDYIFLLYLLFQFLHRSSLTNKPRKAIILRMRQYLGIKIRQSSNILILIEYFRVQLPQRVIVFSFHSNIYNVYLIIYIIILYSDSSKPDIDDNPYMFVL